MKYKSIIMILFIIFLSVSLVYADSNRVGTVGALELRLPVGARSTALSGAVISSVTGPEALYWNPAGAASTQGYEAMFSYGQMFADIKMNYFALTAASGGIGTLGFSAKLLDVGEWEQTTTVQPEGNGVMVKPSFWVMGVSYSKQMTDRVAFGGTMNFVQETIMNTSASGFAFDFGFQYTTPLQGLNFGIVLKSIGPDMSYDGADLESRVNLNSQDPTTIPKSPRINTAPFEIPSNIMFGLSYQALKTEMYTMSVMSDAQFNNHSDDEFRFGGEFAYNDLFFLRGGFVSCGQTDYLYSGTFGAGLKLKMGGSNLIFDYAYVPTEFFDNQSWYTLRMSF